MSEIICLAVAILILILLIGKWLAFFFISPYIIWANRKATQTIPQTQIVGTEERYSGQKVKRSIRSVLKGFKRFLDGAYRYYDIQVGMIPSHHVRNWIYRHIFRVKLDKKAIIYYGAEIRSHSRLSIGNSIIGDKAILDARNGIKIGDYVNMSTGVQIWTEQHSHSDPWFRCFSGSSCGVTICDRAWIGPRVTILHSVHIGEGAVVAAGAVVAKDVEPYSIVAGIPAKKIGERSHDLKYTSLGDHIPFY